MEPSPSAATTAQPHAQPARLPAIPPQGVEYPQHPEVYDSRQTLSRSPTLDSMGRTRDTLGKHGERDEEKAAPAAGAPAGPPGPPGAGGPPAPPGARKFAHSCKYRGSERFSCLPA